ncbi:hypothetical protein ACIRD3_22465 [Kitasatospora sp. NPDC093550]|uniref:hypothetical protein n=1 Tax=Kitasatospora sp. NPDC093550 TaxID=3364089 RepID=UPI0037F14E42
MKRPRRALGCSAAAVLVLATGAGLFYNGYGPMALKDRDNARSPRETRMRLNGTLQAAMGAITPPLAYSGGFYAVDREPDHADGEPSLLSGVREVVAVRTKVAPAKVQVLLDRMSQLWGDCRRTDTTVEYLHKCDTDLNCSGHGEVLFTLSVTTSTADSSVKVHLSGAAFLVRFQPREDYGTPPVGERPSPEPAPDLDDPYWSH